MLVNPHKANEIDAAAKRISGKEPAGYGLKPVHNYYWRGDYTQHVRPGYSFNVRTVSTRTIRTESGNNENLLGTVLPDGSTNIVRRGNEYHSIMPAWEWDKIPSVTSRDYDTANTIKKNWGGRESQSSWVAFLTVFMALQFIFRTMTMLKQKSHISFLIMRSFVWEPELKVPHYKILPQQ